MRNAYESITDFIFMEDPLEKGDVILIPGGSHPQLMARAVELYHQGYAPYILPSGGPNKKLQDHKTEFEYLKSIALAGGVPEAAILKEDQARHTFDNGALSLKVLRDHEIAFRKVILVCKNFHARRAYMTYKLHFPKDTHFIVQPIMDNKAMTRDNWMTLPEHREKVMGEVKKIGAYFLDHMAADL